MALVSSLSSDKIGNFKKSLSGNAKTLQEGEQGYDEAIHRYSSYAVKKAGMVVQVTSLQDIIETVKFARENNLDFAVCSGGYNASGASSSEGGIVLDMKELRNVRVDPEQKLAYIQGGAKWKDVNEETQKYGLACAGPCFDSVGVGGYSLSGGFGYLTGKYGLSIDNVVAATIVLADGSVKKLSATSNPDLFWAIRGCGFNFGVIHEFVIKAYEHPNDVYAGMLVFPGEKFEQVLEKVQEWDVTKKDDEMCVVVLGRMPPELQPTVLVLLFLDSPSSEEFRSRFSKIYSMEPIMDTTRAMSYSESGHIYNEFFKSGDRTLGLSANLHHPFTNSSIKKAWQSFIDFTDPTKELGKNFALSALQFDFHSYEGLKKINNDETAFPYRDRSFHTVYITAKWPDNKYDQEVSKWLHQTREIFYEDTTKDYIVFANCSSPFKEDMDKILKPEIVYGKENLEKLKELKRKYDPTGLFNKWIPIKI